MGSVKKLQPFFRKIVPWLIVFLIIPAASGLYAGQGGEDGISWVFLVINLFGGLAFFLYGMDKMSSGMKKTAGNQMRMILSALTKNRVIALLVGAFVTMVIQSSSATTVMLVSFVQAGLMSFTQSLGVILGADIGTTVTAQMIAFKLTDYALLMIVAGFGIRFFTKSDHIRNIGEIIIGVGILFYGMKLMSDAMAPLRTHSLFVDLMKGLTNPLYGLLIGMVATALLQSSSAFTGIVIVLAQQGLIQLEAGIPLIFGSNIGTCITAMLASIGTSRDAKRVATAHVMFKVAGVLLFIFWIPEFAAIIQALAVKFSSGVARQIANAHTIFNVGLGLIFLPFTGIFSRLILRLLPDREQDAELEIATWFLDEKSITTPALAIDLARAEISRVAKLLGRMLRAIIIPFMSDERLITREPVEKEEMDLLLREIPKRDEIFPELSLLEGIDMREDKIDFLEEKIGQYLVEIARQDLSEIQASEVYGMISIIKDMESIGDIIHRNILPLIAKKKALKMDFSKDGKEELMIFHSKVERQIAMLRDAFSERDPKKALEIMSREKRYLDLESRYRVLHLERLLCEHQESIETHEIHMELMDLMKQIIVYSSNIAKTFVATCGEGGKEGAHGHMLAG